MAVFTSALTRDAPSTELFGNLRILETIPAPERRIRGARGALSYDAGRVRLLTFWTVPLVEARKARTSTLFSPFSTIYFANHTLPLIILPAGHTHGLLRNFTWNLTLGADVKATRTIGIDTRRQA